MARAHSFMSIEVDIRHQLAAVPHKGLHLLERPSRLPQQCATQAADLMKYRRIFSADSRVDTGLCERPRQLLG